MGPLGHRRSTHPAQRAAVAAWALAALLFGVGALILASLAERGVALCGRRLVPVVHHHHAMAMPVAEPAGDGWCPIVVYAALVAGALAAAAVVALVSVRVGPGAALAALARLIDGAGSRRITLVAVTAGAAPPAAFSLTEPATFAGWPALLVCAMLAACAFGAAQALLAGARALVRYGRRIIGGWLRLVALLAPPAPVRVAVRARPLARRSIASRRRSPRAPPSTV